MTRRDQLSRRELLGQSAAAGTGLVVASVVVAGGAGVAEAKDKKAKQTKKKLVAKPTVPRRVLGKTGQKVPILLVGGAVDLDPKFDPKLAAALEYGVDYFDGARVYGGGRCEPAIGNFLARSKQRDKVWITSKAPSHDPEGFGTDLDKSLKELQTNRVDLYFLHGLKDAKYLSKEMGKKADALKKSGKMRYFGFSCHDGNVAELLQLAASNSYVDVVMFRYNFQQYGNKELNAAMDACAKANVGLIAMKTQGSAASFEPAWKPFSKDGYTKHQAVLKAVWADKRITAAVSHMDTLGKLEENVAAAVNKRKLSALETEALQQYAADARPYTCDGCDHICGAAVDAPVQIADTLRFLMYHDVYGEKAKAKRLYSELPAAARAVRGVDFSRANDACPHGVNVAWHMERARKLLG